MPTVEVVYDRAAGAPYVYRTTYPRSGTPYFCNQAMIDAGSRAVVQALKCGELEVAVILRDVYLAMEATRQACLVPEPDAGLMGPDWRARMAAEPVPVSEAQAGEALS